MIWLFLVILIVLFWAYKQSKINVEFKSFFQPSLPLDRGVFGVYLFSGGQGSGKTYGVNKFIRKHLKGKILYSNITLTDIDYIPIQSYKHLLSLRDKKNVFIIYDELFSLLTKSSKIEGELLEFLSQQRKQKNILMTTAQYWLNINVDFRRYVQIHILCKTVPLGRFGGIFYEEYEDAQEMKWDKDANEYIAPRIAKKISKYERKFMLTYDTYERVRRFSDVSNYTVARR